MSVVELITGYISLCGSSRKNVILKPKSTGKILRAQGNHGEFYFDWSVATLY